MKTKELSDFEIECIVDNYNKAIKMKKQGNQILKAIQKKFNLTAPQLFYIAEIRPLKEAENANQESHSRASTG